MKRKKIEGKNRLTPVLITLILLLSMVIIPQNVIAIPVPPDDPTGLAATAVSKTQIDLSWTNGIGAIRTYIERNITQPWDWGKGTMIYNGTDESFSDTGLTHDTTYYYQIWNWNESGWSGYDEASATTFLPTPTIDTWQNILNMSTEDLYYDQIVDLKFNGSIIIEDCRLYQPSYHTEYDSDSGKYEVWTNWTRIGGWISSGDDEPTLSDVNLTVSGLWLVCADNPPSLHQVNMSNMSIYDISENAWENITGWFWVNSSEWSIELSKSSIYYDKNESLTITVYKGENKVTSTGWIDIWNISGSNPTLVYHKEITAAMEGVWEISGTLMHTLTHNKGAGTYRVTAYEDIDPDHDEAEDIYGLEGGATKDGEMGFNSTFGNTTEWADRFIASGTITLIRNYSGGQVDTDTWSNTTYKWDSCGPFDPPEYWADYENFTLEAGVPTFQITNETVFWNDTHLTKVEINVTDYDGNGLAFDKDDVMLYNKSNRPSRSGSIPIGSDYYNVSAGSKGAYYVITITPNGTGLGNRWGWNRSDNSIWAEKGIIYIVIANGTAVGNATDEWNGTAEITLISPKATFKWVDDGSAPLTDGELLDIPDIGSIPYDFKFQIINSDYEYFGADGITGAAENITITGDSLFTGTLDIFPGFDNSWYSGDTTWTVPMIPMMDMNGGEITITVKAWNETIKGTLYIGGSEYWNNGTVVSVIPNEFKIDEADRTLSITAQDGTGYNLRGADVYLHYIGDDGVPIQTHIVDHITSDSNGDYNMLFNITQQTDNQTEAGLEIKAPRNLIIYVSSSIGPGYAKIVMIPVNDLEVELSQTTFIAGYSYDTIWINCTFIDSNETPNSDDRNQFFIEIYNETGSDVTDTLLSDGAITSADLTGESDYAYELNDVYITEPGTYTVYAYNNTHDSTDHNATFVVEQVTVECDKSPFIWGYDNNISATFTVTYQGAPINGSLVIDNLTDDPADYNQTWMNTSFDGINDLGDSSSIEIDEDDLINGQITIHDITANNLPNDTAQKNITFWFMPASPYDGAYARTQGMVPVKIPDITPTPGSLPCGELVELRILLTGRGTPLDDLLVNITVPALREMSTRTDGTGIALFTFLPLTTGDITIKVENRTSDVKVPVTSWKLYIDVDTQANEGESFTVTVRNNTISGSGVYEAAVIFNRETKTTDASGQATFTAPSVTSDREYTILATKEGHAEDTETILIINRPKLIVVAPSKAITGEAFQVTIANDVGNPIIGATVTINNKDYTSGSQGIATLTAPSAEGNYEITASKTGFTTSDPVTIEVKPGGIPGFELLTLIAAIGVAFILLRRRRN